MIRKPTLHRLAGLALMALATLALSSGAWAQGSKGELKNIRSFKFFVTGFSEYNKQCGLTPEVLRQAFTAPMTEAGLKVVQSSTAYWITLRVTSVPQGERNCVSYVDAATNQTTRYFNNATLAERVGTVQHWSGGRIIVSDIVEHAEVASEAFRALGRNLVATWRRDQ